MVRDVLDGCGPELAGKFTDSVGPIDKLYVWGDVAALSGQAVAVVGSRAASPYGVRLATELAADLATDGFVIASGGALGIDVAAHRAALAAGGSTIVVLPCGLDRATPTTHRALFEDVAGTPGCAVVSEYPDGTFPQRQRFLARNRVIAALSNGVVVVESAQRSGSLSTARRASELGRPVMAVPGPVTSPTSSGTNELIRSGALLVTSADQVSAALNSDGV